MTTAPGLSRIHRHWPKDDSWNSHFDSGLAMLSLIDYQILIRLCRYSDPIIWSLSGKIFWSNDLTIRQDILIKWSDYLARYSDQMIWLSGKWKVWLLQRPTCRGQLLRWGGVGHPPNIQFALMSAPSAHHTVFYTFLQSSTIFFGHHDVFYSFLHFLQDDLHLYLLNHGLTVLLLYKEYHYTQELQSWAF